MRKTDKKIDNRLRIALTEVCETALKDIEGFSWLTHTVNYSNFPQSLRVICVFETNEQLAVFRESGQQTWLLSLIQTELSKIGVKLNNLAMHVVFDSEQACSENHAGNWSNRLTRLQ